MTEFKPLDIQIGSDTNIGGSRDNQDDFFQWTDPLNNICVICVLDGHGRDYGKIIAEEGKKAIVELLDSRGGELLGDAPAFLIQCFSHAHEAIKNALILKIAEYKWETRVTESGNLQMKKYSTSAWANIQGGTTCTIIAVVGRNVYTANVGDSSALLCTKYPILQKSLLNYIIDSSIPSGTILENELYDNSPTSSLEITPNHSANSKREFVRTKPFDLKYKYDNPRGSGLGHSYSQDVFKIDEATGEISLNEPTQGKYYYNTVRKDIASIVTTPDGSDSLAMTRALGDFNLKLFGVSELPEIQCFSVDEIFDRIKHNFQTSKILITSEIDDGEQTPTTSSVFTNPEATTEASISVGETERFCIVLASDGVWDNWIYDHVQKFVMDPSCIKAIEEKPEEGVQRVAKSFMGRNMMFSKKNFGSQADNATVIVMYLTR